jgi:hypothetical protein
MSQAMAIYVLFAFEVLVICWFGTQLTQRVSVNYLLLLLFLVRQEENAGEFPRY